MFFIYSYIYFLKNSKTQMTNGKRKHMETWIPNIESEVCDTVYRGDHCSNLPYMEKGQAVDQ